MSNSDIAAIIAIKNDLQLLDWQGSLALSMLPGGHKRSMVAEANGGACPVEMSLIPKTSEEFDLWCRRHGLRVTNKRRAVAEIALLSKDYPDLDQLRSRIAAVHPRISLATVYNTLRLLAEFGLIERHKFRGRPTRYGSAHQVRQGHLIDVTSGRVVPVQRNREPSR